MDCKTSYFYITYLATTLDGRQCTGSINIEVNRPMFNSTETIKDIVSNCKRFSSISPNSVVILNWIKFNSKTEYDLFTRKDYE